MEPTLPAPHFNPEQSRPYTEQSFEQGLLSPEGGLERIPERIEQRAEATPVAVDAFPVLPTPVVVPAPSVVVSTDGATAEDTGLPSVAADDDVIEKEWVDKAKQIIAHTKDDPHRREQEVAKLQVDYLRKRYGKELGSFDV